jgi:hypothetical protein
MSGEMEVFTKGWMGETSLVKREAEGGPEVLSSEC